MGRKRKLNCWEVMNCGMQEGCSCNEEKICPVSRDKRADGIHGGKCGGRSCWIVSKLSGEKKDADILFVKMEKCHNCKFYKMVVEEEGDNLLSGTEIFTEIHKK